MVAEDGTAKLLDIGLAKLTGELARPSTVSLPRMGLDSLPGMSTTRRDTPRVEPEEKTTLEVAETIPPPDNPEISDTGRSVEELLGALSSEGLTAIDSRARSLPAMGTISGTPAYMAPKPGTASRLRNVRTSTAWTRTPRPATKKLAKGASGNAGGPAHVERSRRAGGMSDGCNVCFSSR